MPKVYIPAPMRPLVGGQDVVDCPGATVRELIGQLDAQFPGLAARLVQGDQMRPGLVVAVGSSVSSLGMLQPLEENDEVHFLPAVGGGSQHAS